MVLLPVHLTVFKRAVLHHLRIQSAVRGVIEILKKQAVQDTQFLVILILKYFDLLSFLIHF